MTTYLLGVVGVFRKCRQCGEWKAAHNFPGSTAHWQGHVCNACSKPGPHLGKAVSIRTLTITDSGREYLASLKRGTA